ncbi:MAG: ABC transporter permease, partial [Nitrospinota bacterium]
MIGRLWRMSKPLLEGVTATLFGLLLGGLLLLLSGFNPLTAYSALYQGALGDHYALASTLAEATPLILTGLTFAIGMRSGLFNIGAQGQVFLGAVAAVGANLLPWPAGTHLLASILLGMIAGALWSLPAALLKAVRGVHEVISTIMLNWIAWYLSLYLAAAVLVDPNRAEKTIAIAPEARLLPFFPGTDLTPALLLSILFALLIYWILWHTALGYEIRAVGLNPNVARYGGIRPTLTLSLSFVLGGFAAGLAGATQVIGRPPTYALYGDLSNVANLGFDGIVVALVGSNHPLGIIVAATLMGALSAGARTMQIYAGVPLEMVKIVQGVIILALAVPELLRLFTVWYPARRLLRWGK